MTQTLRARLNAARARAEGIRRQMIATQEELDWRCYRLYGLIEEDLEYHPSPLSSVAPGGLPSPQPLSQGERGSSLPSPLGGGAGGKGKKKHGVLPADLLANARDLRKGQTDAESLLWLLLRDRRLGGFKFRRQHPVPPYVLDFYCHEKRLAVELDGGQHAEQAARDERRTAELERQGIRVIRFWNNAVLAETEGVLEAIWQVLHSPLPAGEGPGVRGIQHEVSESQRDSPHPNPSPDGRGALPGIALGERAFEIVMARRMTEGELETAWFARHGSTPITALPEHWPEDYRRLVERRIALIESDRNIGLIERPEYKRRWSWTPWEEQERDALRGWLLDRIEARFSGRSGTAQPSAGQAPEPRLTTSARLADRLHDDAEFLEFAAVYRGRMDFDLAALVAELVEAESVPFLPVLRYKDSGLRKHAQWEETWRLQRREDAIDAASPLPAGEGPGVRGNQHAELGDIPVPPKYNSADFLKTGYWRLRGSLDVPKERFVSYPGCERDADRSLPITWAGWNALQQAMVIATYYLDMKDREGWTAERLTPLLAGIQALLPWILQWHNDYDPDSDQRMGDYFTGFLAEEARTLDLTLEALSAWRPPAQIGARRGRKPNVGS